MNKKCIYIGENSYFLHKMQQACFNIQSFKSDYPLLALNYIRDNPEIEIVFFEANIDLSIAIQYIKFFKENLSREILFFALTLQKSHIKNLFLAGADDVFSTDLNTDNLKKRIEFLLEFKKKSIKIDNNESQIGNKVIIPVWKRMMDIILSSFAIFMLIPVFILIAILIRLESKGKVFYSSKRVGSGYKVFNFYKFRSMFSDADKKLNALKTQNQYASNNNVENPKKDQNNILGDTILLSDNETILEQDFLKQKKENQENNFFKVVNDPRITRIGRFIRNTSIDELPQLFNILKGDMSIVGNRPLPLYEAEMLTTDRWVKRFLGPAGLTGLWQVTKRGGANKMSSDERKQLDIDYINNLSFGLDLKIIMKTIPAMLQHENV